MLTQELWIGVEQFKQKVLWYSTAGVQTRHSSSKKDRYNKNQLQGSEC